MEFIAERADNLRVSELIHRNSTYGDVGMAIDCYQYSGDRRERKLDFLIDHITKALPLKKLKPVQLSRFEKFVTKWWDKRVNRVSTIDDLYELLSFGDQAAMGVIGTAPQSIKRQLRKLINQYTGSPVGDFMIQQAGKRMKDFQLVKLTKDNKK